MKKIICTAVSAMALAAFAEGVNSTEFGTLTVQSSAAQTIVGVPWIQSGTSTTTPVNVADLVLTAGLNVGDQLKLYDPSEKTKYKIWTLAVDESGNKYWAPNTVYSSKGMSETPDPNDQGINRGQAILLTRTAPIATKFYIMGKPSDTAGSVTLLNGTSETPAYTLVAPPFVTETDVNEGISWSGIDGETDSLILSDGTTLVYKNSQSKWCRWTGSAWKYDYKIPAGTGCWFVTTGTGAKSVSWTAK